MENKKNISCTQERVKCSLCNGVGSFMYAGDTQCCSRCEGRGFQRIEVEKDEYHDETLDYFLKKATADKIKIKILDKEGFDFVAFEYENEFLGKAILKAMEIYRNWRIKK